MNVVRAYKTELDLNNIQRTACKRHAGAARYAYNWGLSRKIEAYRKGEKTPSAIDLHRELNQLKQGKLSWMYELSKCAPQEALRNLDSAFAHFFRRVREKRSGKKVKVGFPRYKSKKNGVGSFRLTGAIHIYEDAIQLPRLGVLRLKERGYLPCSGVHILSVTVSEHAGGWYVSVQVEMERADPQPEEKPVAGIDLGIARMATVSDGQVIENPRALRQGLVQLRRQQRIVSRRQTGSANRRKAVEKLAKTHQRAANIRKETLHQATSLLAKTKSVVVLENLNVSGMMKNRRLAQAVADVGFYEFRRQMIYKGKWYGCQVLEADRYYPSTKRCSCCGNVKAEMGLGERVYACEACGMVLDRDLNAALNLEQLITASSAGIDACGEGVRPERSAVLDEAGTEPQSAFG